VTEAEVKILATIMILQIDDVNADADGVNDGTKDNLATSNTDDDEDTGSSSDNDSDDDQRDDNFENSNNGNDNNDK
jgi:hypothetical protein